MHCSVIMLQCIAALFLRSVPDRARDALGGFLHLLAGDDATIIFAQDDVDGVVVEVLDDRRILRASSYCSEAERRIEHHARRGVEHGLRLLRGWRVALEVSAVSLRKSRNVATEHGQGLGANDVIGRGRTALGNARHVAALAPPEIVAPMPGKVVQVLVKPGDQVESGDGLLILEAMKMENRLVAEAVATVAEVRVSEGDMVEGGQVLIVLRYREESPS